MPEHKAKSGSKKDINKAVSENIKEMHSGEHHGERVKKHGKETAHKMEVAAAEKIARGKESGKKEHKDKLARSGGSSKKQTRNLGRR
jgi:hypothetical protein